MVLQKLRELSLESAYIFPMSGWKLSDWLIIGGWWSCGSNSMLVLTDDDEHGSVDKPTLDSGPLGIVGDTWITISLVVQQVVEFWTKLKEGCTLSETTFTEVEQERSLGLVLGWPSKLQLFFTIGKKMLYRFAAWSSSFSLSFPLLTTPHSIKLLNMHDSGAGKYLRGQRIQLYLSRSIHTSRRLHCNPV